MSRLIALLFTALICQGCYYMQAATGQMEVLRKRESLEQVIKDPETPDSLAARLQLVSEARDFSVSDLALPDNGSYRSYADLERDYVVWNIFAAPELSVTPRSWCFPVAGCISYRGYFREDRAIAHAERLREQGFDVVVGGVAAYSTLGRFDDPVLNTMMRWDDVSLVATVFHELAHQVVYVKDDSSFNESFATAVEEIGVERWLARDGDSTRLEGYRQRREAQQEFNQLLAETREALDRTYRSESSDEQKREQKRRILLELKQRIAEFFAALDRPVPAHWSGDLNNAHLVSSSLYRGRLPAFRALYDACDKELECFYLRVREIADLARDERDNVLSAGR